MRTLLALVGNDVMGDDGVSYHILRHVEDKLPGHIRSVKLHGDVLRLLHFYRGEERIVFVDATTAIPCGEVAVLSFEEAQKLDAPMLHAHMLGLIDSVRLMEKTDVALASARKELFLVGVTPVGVRPGRGLSSCLEDSLPAVSERLLDVLGIR